VLAHWRTSKPAFRVELGDGTILRASRDHRFLTARGWKYVAPTPGARQRSVLTPDDSLLGFGRLRERPAQGIAADYARGYLCGVIRGDGHLGAHRYTRAGRADGNPFRFRVAPTDREVLIRTAHFLAGFGVSTDRSTFACEAPGRRRIEAIRASSPAAIEAIHRLTMWPGSDQGEVARGFVAGAFDAEGSCSQGVLRIAF